MTVNKIETIQDFKEFLNDNRDKLISKSVKIENLSPDDEWLQDDSWDKIYKKAQVKEKAEGQTR